MRFTDSFSSDAELPLVVDASRPLHPPSLERAILLTGATGFLGRHLLRELLATRAEPVICLVRASDAATARQRLLPLLSGSWPQRLEVVVGDLAQPQFGLSDLVYRWLLERIAWVVHAAADVNWVKGYRQLRTQNVLATAELIRFCLAAQAHSMLFVSTLAVCFARGVAGRIDEDSNLFNVIERMPLGYAQSKCVAEQLLRRAATVGLDVCIVRPGLLCGDTATGTANTQDVVAALLNRCTHLGLAPDVDWVFESIPVDYAARAICTLGQRQSAGLEVHHLRHPRPRHWRELMLWLHLAGYPMKLIAIQSWLQHAFAREAPAPRATPLLSYRRLFVSSVKADDAQTHPFEVYLSQGQAAICSARTDARLATYNLECPALDASMLHKQTAFFERTGVLPRRPQRPEAALSSVPYLPPGLVAQVEVALSTAARAGLVSSPWHWERLGLDTRDGLLSEAAMAAGHAPPYAGLVRWRVSHAALLDHPGCDLVTKLKAHDQVLIQALINMALMVDTPLGQAFQAQPEVLGMSDVHRREPALYRLAPAGARPYMAPCYGTLEPSEPSPGQAYWGLTLGYLPGRVGHCQRQGGWRWHSSDTLRVLEALGDLQASWLGCGMSQLASRARLCAPLTTIQAQSLGPAWQAMARFSAPIFAASGAPELPALHHHLLHTLPSWWRRYDALPLTLIHNDCNPRNLVLPDDPCARPCWLDWELATLGPAQQDSAELLCFVLPSEASDAWIAHALEVHRRALCAHSGQDISAQAWVAGFELALNRYLLQRLPLYALMGRFQSQAFLPALLSNWLRLKAWSSAIVAGLEGA